MKSSGVMKFCVWYFFITLFLQQLVSPPCLHFYRFTTRKSSLRPGAGSDPSLTSSIDLEAETRRYSTTRNIFDRAVRPTQLGLGRPAWPGQLWDPAARYNSHKTTMIPFNFYLILIFFFTLFYLICYLFL